MLIKFLHTADLHLDSSMNSYLPKEKAKERKNELLLSFENMVKYADNAGIGHILIAGDMFDKNVFSEKCARFVENVILTHPDITFYYLKGNHDLEGFLDRIEKPKNLLTFSEDRWDKYTIANEGEKKVCIYGTELAAESQAGRLTDLQPEEKDINIVMLHGQENDYVGKDKEVRIDLPRLKGKAIDYLALGHVHAPKISRLDARGLYSYPGCPEGRGFDECGARGFNVLTVDTVTGDVSVEFIEKSIRKVMDVKADISDARTSLEALERVERLLGEKLNQNIISAEDIVKIRLSGNIGVDAEVDADLIERHLSGDFYYLRVVDETGHIVDYNAYRNDKSLKGEFVRQVEKATDLSEEEKADIIRTGILLLAGRKEEV